MWVQPGGVGDGQQRMEMWSLRYRPEAQLRLPGQAASLAPGDSLGFPTRSLASPPPPPPCTPHPQEHTHTCKEVHHRGGSLWRRRGEEKRGKAT